MNTYYCHLEIPSSIMIRNDRKTSSLSLKLNEDFIVMRLSQDLRMLLFNYILFTNLDSFLSIPKKKSVPKQRIVLSKRQLKPDEINNAVTVIETIILFILHVPKHSLNGYWLLSQKLQSMCQERAVQMYRGQVCDKEDEFL